MRQLRDSKRLKSLIRAGKTIEVLDRNQVIADIVPRKPKAASSERPDFAAQAKAILHGRKVSGSALLLEDRGRY